MFLNRELSKSDYGTHIVPLLASVFATRGDILELGMGDYSTPVLHEIIRYQWSAGVKRFLFSWDNNREWVNNFIDLATNFHFIECVDFKDTLDVPVLSVVL